MKLKIYPEYEEYVIHNHFDCPSCGTEYAATSVYWDLLDINLGSTFYCEECFSEFMLKEKFPDFKNWEWEEI